MSYKKELIIKAIADNLAFTSKSTGLRNILGLFDSNRIAQDFFVWLFSLVFGYKNLKELDKLNGIVNYPAIDLGDEVKKIAFQITTKKDSGKVKDTIEKFIFYKLYKKYDRLVIFIIGEKQGSYVDFDTKGNFIFNKESDIWDDNFLIKEIDKITDIQKLEEIKKYLEENLVEFKFPENLFPSDIKKCIEILKRDFWSSETLSLSLNIKREDDNFIKDVKNPANNLSWEFFKDKIRGHLQYNQDIVDFLQSPINQELQKDYLKITQAIQDYYKNSENKFSSFEEVFRKVFDKCNILYDDDLNKIKIMILLHNMYFNCDIGHNPNNHD